MNPFRRRPSKPDMMIRTSDETALARIPAEIYTEMQYLWTRLQIHKGAKPSSIGVTSYRSGEGVSMVSLALAAVGGLADRTCLVETNWWSASRLPLPQSSPGLAAVLQGSAGLDEVLLATDDPGLSIVPSGELASSSEPFALENKALRAVLVELGQEYRHVIVDLPPLTATSTALKFASAVDATLLVARQRVVRADDVELAMADLRHANLLGVVLNANNISTPRILRPALADY